MGSIHQHVLEGGSGQIHVILHVQLLVGPGATGRNRLVAQLKFLRDLDRLQAGGDQNPFQFLQFRHSSCGALRIRAVPSYSTTL
jgi:hypothetical protein